MLKDKLKQIRLSQNPIWSQETAADECGISASLWEKMEQGKMLNPRLSTLMKIALKTKRSIDWLVDFQPELFDWWKKNKIL